jgi:Polyketide cyclase / dehydrase and lipid transport
MIDLDLDYGVTHLDFSVTYPYPAPAVFEAITDFPAYPWWQPNVGVRAAGALPCGPGSQVLQVHDVMGRQTEVTLTVTDCELDRMITLQTPAGERPGVRQAYRLQPTGDGGCRLDFHLELDGVPRMAEHLVKTELGQQVKRFFETLGAIVAGRPAATPAG